MHNMSEVMPRSTDPPKTPDSATFPSIGIKASPYVPRKESNMADEDYDAEVGRYDDSVDTAAVAGIKKHLGIALKGNDSKLVSCSDASELETVRESWCKRKLELTDSDADLDASISAVCSTMKADHNKLRVTFYYLLAKHYGKLESLH
jgi:hypothetical protein